MHAYWECWLNWIFDTVVVRLWHVWYLYCNQFIFLFISLSSDSALFCHLSVNNNLPIISLGLLDMGDVHVPFVRNKFPGFRYSSFWSYIVHWQRSSQPEFLPSSRLFFFFVDRVELSVQLRQSVVIFKRSYLKTSFE